MDDQRIGRALRVLRQRNGLRQADVAIAARVSQALVSNIEQGRLAGVTFGVLRRVFAAVDAGFDGQVLWRGSGLDRVLDADHARLVGIAAERLSKGTWQTVVEPTYSVYGERGSIDLLAGMRDRRAVLVEEIKTSLASVEATLRKLDEKVRLVAERLSRDQFGWTPTTVGRLLVLPDTTTARRQVAKHDGLLRIALPARATEVRQWLREPVGQLSGILFLPIGSRSQPAAARQRVHTRKGSRYHPE